MSCKCQDLKGFELIMFNAKDYEQRTNRKTAVFVVGKETLSFTELANIDKVDGICCYFTTDGVEHKITKPKTEKKTKKK